MLWLVLYIACIFQALFMLIWSVRCQKDLISPPVLFSLVVLLWFYPTLPDTLDNPYLFDDTMELFLLFWLFCQTAFYLGYHIRLSKRLTHYLRKDAADVDYKVWLQASFLLSLLGAFAFFQYSRLPAEMLYMRQPSGIITIYLFFASFLTVALYVAVFAFIRKRWVLCLVPITVALALYADRILFHAKRTDLFELMLLAAVAWMIALNRRVPVLLIAMSGAALLAWNFLVFDIRPIMKSENRDVAAVQEIQFTENIKQRFFSEDRNVVNALIEFQAYMSNQDKIRLGSDYWNVIVNKYVPGQLIGAERKTALMLDRGEDALWTTVMYTRPTGTTTFSAGGAFGNFGWFGFLLFALYGFSLKVVFFGARQGKFVLLVFYMIVGGMIPGTIIFGFRNIIAIVLLWWPFLWFVARLSKVRVHSRPEIALRKRTSAA